MLRRARNPDVPRHVRRSHAERTAETRAKIIAAVVDSIAELGYQGTTAQEIARRAGVTWGAVQHHFGSKDAMMRAVLDDAFARFAARVRDIPLDLPLHQRAAIFLARAWEHFRSRYYRSTFEILLNYLGREDVDNGDDWRGRMWHAWNSEWSRVFADARVPRRRSLSLQRFTISALSGLASSVMLRGAGAASPKKELELLKDTLLRELRWPHRQEDLEDKRHGRVDPRGVGENHGALVGGQPQGTARRRLARPR